MSRPRLLDLFSGAGGCSVGYHRAGFDVTGVDIEAHKDYPYAITVGDAMAVLADVAYLDTFDVVHASPPCQAYTAMGSFGTMGEHPDLLADVMDALRAWGGTWVVENVPGAPFPEWSIPVTFCGSGLGLRMESRPGFYLKRHRLFASNAFLMSPGCDHRGSAVPVVGHGTPSSFRARHGFDVGAVARRALMGCDWMRNRDDVSEAVPPAYTEHVGTQLLDQIEAAA